MSKFSRHIPNIKVNKYELKEESVEFIFDENITKIPLKNCIKEKKSL